MARRSLTVALDECNEPLTFFVPDKFGPKRHLTDRGLDRLRRDFPDSHCQVLADLFKVSLSIVYGWAKEFGLEKSAAYKAMMTKARSEKAKGHPVSEEQRAKIRAKLTGTTFTDERLEVHKAAMKKNRPRGERHYNWKGGITEPTQRATPEYAEWRKAVLVRDNFTCQQCGRKVRDRDRGLEAHHIKFWAEHPELRFEVSNGLTLCRPCHLKLHGLAPRKKETVECECGCGTLIPAFYEESRRPRRFVNGHNARLQPEFASGRVGRRQSPETRAKVSEARRRHVARSRSAEVGQLDLFG